jgi:hypothetical protein
MPKSVFIGRYMIVTDLAQTCEYVHWIWFIYKVIFAIYDVPGPCPNSTFRSGRRRTSVDDWWESHWERDDRKTKK